MSDQKTDSDIQDIEVLVVEDSLTQAFLLQASLEECKISVNVARDGVEAWQKMKAKKPHVVISDIKMPEMDGYELCRRIKTDPFYQDVPVILLTSLSDPMDVIRGIACGCDSFITKPFEINSLISMIKDARANIQLHQGLRTPRTIGFFFKGQYHELQIDHEQIIGLLLSTYSNAIQKNVELMEAYHQVNLFSDELKKKNDELREMNRLKYQLLGMAAHDLRSPLSLIAEYSEVLVKDLKVKIDESYMKMLENINTSSDMMLRLINELLDFSVIESGTVTLHLSPIDMPSLIEENLKMLKSLADKKDVRLVFNHNDSVPKVYADANKIAQVLNNLITNAIKFSKQGEAVEVSLIPYYREVRLLVKDHGAGLNQEAVEKLLQPFSKLSGGLGSEKGPGLGLAIVNKIIMEHKGKIWVESELGKGTTFFVSLPYGTESQTDNRWM